MRPMPTLRSDITATTTASHHSPPLLLLSPLFLSMRFTLLLALLVSPSQATISVCMSSTGRHPRSCPRPRVSPVGSRRLVMAAVMISWC